MHLRRAFHLGFPLCRPAQLHAMSQASWRKNEGNSQIPANKW